MSVRKKITITTIAVFLLAFAILAALILWQPKISVANNGSFEIVDKLRELQKNGGSTALNEGDINDVIKIYFKGNKSYKDFFIKGVYANIKQDNMTLSIPVKYKKINLMVSTKGKLTYVSNRFVYEPEYFKIGKLTVPMSMTYKVIGGPLKKYASIEGKKIILNKRKLPLTIESLKIMGNKVIVSAPKPLAKKPNSGGNPPSNNQPASTGAVATTGKTDSGSSGGNTVQDNNNNNSNGSSGTTTTTDSGDNGGTEPETADEKAENLKLLVSQLDTAIGKVNGAEEKQMLSTIQEVARKLLQNPNYYFKNEEVAVKANYNKLSKERQKNLKGVILGYVDIDNLYELKAMFP